MIDRLEHLAVMGQVDVDTLSQIGGEFRALAERIDGFRIWLPEQM